MAHEAVQRGASQEYFELRDAMRVVQEVKPRVIVELGCDRGGTLYAWRQLCDRVYGITWEQNADSEGAECVTHGAEVRFADTHDPASLQWLKDQLNGDPVDVLIVDGDHHKDGIIADLKDYGPLVRPGGLIMLHDVVPEMYPEVHVWKVWPALRDKYRTSQIGTYFGWGIIYVQEGDSFDDPMAPVPGPARTWESQREAWQRIPVDDLGYFDAAELARLPDYQFFTMARGFEARRYSGWRNAGGLWRREMGLDDITGQRILDYGCGAGIESLQYARRGNHVSIADINQGSLDLACRVLAMEDRQPANAWLISQEPPYIPAEPGSFDVVVMNGVLHHIEDPVPVVREAHRWLTQSGELRIMVYSDEGWRRATGAEPPDDVHGHPKRLEFVRFFDQVGDWADWYDVNRLRQRFGEWFDVEKFTYIAGDVMANQYAIALLRRKP